MTNPNNAIGTNGAFSGRTSPNALNDILGAFSKGIVSGWTCSPKTGMTVQLGGSASTRDVALAEDNAGNKLTIDNRSGAPVEVTLGGAPSTNNRIDAIVAYVDNPSTGDDTTTDNPSTCGIIAVSGTVAANPTAPSDAQIRSAITTDGATGGVAYYVVLATILVGTNVTTIGSGVITQGSEATTEKIALQDGAITTPKIADGAVTSQKADWTTIVTKLYETQNGTNATFQLSESAANFKRLRFFFRSNDGDYSSLDVYEPDGKTISTEVVHPVPTASYSKITLWGISGTTVTKGVSIQVANDGTIQSADYVYITRVEGWQI